MDLPPTIPTSFVPRSASATVRRFRSDFIGVFGFFAYGVLGIVFILALGVFFYDRILAGTQAAKDAALAKAQKAIDPVTVEGFVHLRDRLNSSMLLLGNHVAFSGFFKLLGTLLPTTVRIASLHLAFDGTGKVIIEGSGVAKNFNALAAVSTAFATDGHIKEAIFSGLTVNKDNSVSFALSASLDPSIIAFSP